MKVLTVLALLVATYGIFLGVSQSKETSNLDTFEEYPIENDRNDEEKEAKMHDSFTNSDVSNDDENNGEKEQEDGEDIAVSNPSSLAEKDDTFSVNEVPDDDKGDKEDDDENSDDKQNQDDVKKENDEAADSSDIVTRDNAVHEIETNSNEQDEPSMEKRFWRRRRRRRRRRRGGFIKKIGKAIRKAIKGVKKVAKKIHKGAKKVCKFVHKHIGKAKGPRVKGIKVTVGKVCRYVHILGDEELQLDEGEFEDEFTQRDLDKIKEDETSEELMR